MFHTLHATMDKRACGAVVGAALGAISAVGSIFAANKSSQAQKHAAKAQAEAAARANQLQEEANSANQQAQNRANKTTVHDYSQDADTSTDYYRTPNGGQGVQTNASNLGRQNSLSATSTLGNQNALASADALAGANVLGQIIDAADQLY